MKNFLKFITEQDSKILEVLYDSNYELPYISSLKETPEKHLATIQSWKNIPKTLSPEAKRKMVGEIYAQALVLAKGLQDTLFTVLKKSTQNARKAKILVDIKSHDSFMDKVVNRNKEANKIHDMLRSAILCNDKKEVEEVSKWLRKNTRVHEYEEKTYGSDKEFGYFGSHHFKIYVNKDKMGIIAEIQVMTKALWQYKEKAHQIYNNYRSMSDAEKQSSDAYRKDAAKSRQLFVHANR
jgi:ppGpp synthetase/RelA/SpoT-type nucleotidyltranferase